MPVALSTRFTHAVSLPLFQDLPAGERPEFIVRFLSELQERELNQRVLVIGADELVDAVRERLKVFLAPLIVGTRNFGIDPAPAGAAALEHLNVAELRDLAIEIRNRNLLAYEELKKSRSPQASAPA